MCEVTGTHVKKDIIMQLKPQTSFSNLIIVNIFIYNNYGIFNSTKFDQQQVIHMLFTT